MQMLVEMKGTNSSRRCQTQITEVAGEKWPPAVKVGTLTIAIAKVMVSEFLCFTPNVFTSFFCSARCFHFAEPLLKKFF